jgi:ribosomal protein S19E (S16A)
MEEAPAPSLSPSERQTLRHIAEGEMHASELDWVAVQRLKTMGLIEERDREPMLTAEGQRTLGRIAGSS